MKKLVAGLIFIICISATAHAYDELHVQKNFSPKQEPDILAETVSRAPASATIPLLIVIHHANLYPVTLQKITWEAKLDDGRVLKGGVPPEGNFNEGGTDLKNSLWYAVLPVVPPPDYRGNISIDVTIEAKRRGTTLRVRNNNFLKSKRAPLIVRVGGPDLPAPPEWYPGDIHFHTIFSENQAEFGAPLDVSAYMAEVQGLRWLAFTDHSFDLNDKIGDTTTNDPELLKWKSYLEEIEKAVFFNKNMIYFVGEELSCGNRKGENVHLLMVNITKLTPGDGDGFEGASAPTLPCDQVVGNLEPGALAFAAHPYDVQNVVSKYVINRGMWESSDVRDKGLTGLEFWNYDDAPPREAVDIWVSALLDGMRMPATGGSDAHGEFNTGQGSVRTVAHVPGKFTKSNLVAALRAGHSILTSGPFVDMTIRNNKGVVFGVGDTAKGQKFKLVLRGISTTEFGPVGEITVYYGNLKKKKEKRIATITPATMKSRIDPMRFTISNAAVVPTGPGYLRVEASSAVGERKYYVYTNPIWINAK